MPTYCGTGRLGAAIVRFDLDKDVFRGCLCILDENIKIAVSVEYSCVHQLEFEFVPASAPVFLYQPRIRKLRLRILIEELHVRMRRSRVQVIVILLNILAVIAFTSRESKQTLLQNRVFAVPQSQCKA